MCIIINAGKPILRVPNLCIHLNRGVNDGFAPNTETEMVPILAQAATYELNKVEKVSFLFICISKVKPRLLDIVLIIIVLIEVLENPAVILLKDSRQNLTFSDFFI